MAAYDLSNDDFGAKVRDKFVDITCLIWLDANVNPKETRNTEEKLRSIARNIKRFQDVRRCQQYIEQSSQHDRIVLVVSGRLGQEIVPSIHKRRNVISVYVYCMDKERNEEWALQYKRVKGVVVKLDELISQIKKDHLIPKYTEQPLSINIFTTSTATGKSTSGVNGQFVFSQVLIDCLLRLKVTQADQNELIDVCKQQYAGNPGELNNIREFSQEYSPNKALWWYTRETFFYKILNAALRTSDIHIIFLFRGFICDIQRQLQNNQSKTPLRLYRSQIISNDELKTLRKSLGQFISINSFFSTTPVYHAALSFLDTSHSSDNLEGVLFEIDADPKIVSTKPFANISKYSDYDEAEVLFMLGSIFRLETINRNDDKVNIIRMTLCSDDEHDLKKVLMYMKQQTGNGETNLQTLARFLWEMGKFDLAEKYLMRYLKELPLNDPSIGLVYDDLGKLASASGDFDTSMKWHKKALEFKVKHPSTDDSNTDTERKSITPNVDQCLTWSSQDVCIWIKSLGEVYAAYIDAFKRHNIDGYRLLNLIDNDGLKELGVNSSLNRQVILDGIKQLKIKCAPGVASTTAATNKEFYDDFVGDFVPPLYLTDRAFANTMSCILRPEQDKIHSKLYTQILKWIGPLPNTIDIEKIQLIHNAGLYRIFLQRVKFIEGHRIDGTFQPKLDKETKPTERKKVLDRLQDLTKQVDHNRSAPVVRVWHGCDRTTLAKILSNGFAAISKLDDGWFGTAMYFTSSAEYATKYTNSNGCLIMCYVVLLNPFPVISDDAPLSVHCTKFRFYGKGNYSSYQSHYIPVIPVGKTTSSDFRPPPGGVQDAVYDELAVFQQSDILPQVVVYFKPRSNSAPTADSKSNVTKKFLSKD